jgi:hypothetical protein
VGLGLAKTKFKPEFVEQARKLCLLGATDDQLASFFDVATSTISKWKLDFPEFAEALKGGKVGADMEVAASLYKRATGGDTVAMIFWLKNRARDQWRDKVDHEHGGKDGGPVQHEVAVRPKMTREEWLATHGGTKPA